MNLKTLDLKKAYSSDVDDILHDFYITSLQTSIEYKRLAGFFSSTSLAIAARGILGLIKNGGTMKLIVSPILEKKDLNTIINSYEEPEKYIEKKMLEELDKLEDEFVRDHVFALGWMIANRKLKIKVAIAYDDECNPLNYEKIQSIGLFHQKVGILEDSEKNVISFSGSINETATGWLRNIEEFKVFRSWETSEEDYINADILKFNKFWDGATRGIKVINVPTAVKRKLIKIAPESIEELNLKRWLKREVIKKRKEIELWSHQEEAIKAWFGNNKNGIFEMATGTGKTFAALGCLKKLIESKKKIIIVIACPYNHLIRQWIDSVYRFGIKCDYIIADSSNKDWKSQLSNYLLDIKNKIKEKLIVLTTHNTFPTDDFIKIIRLINEDLFLIVDEVHGIGAPKRKMGLINDYNFRLGLSATPKRWFDLEGTEKLFDYFGDTVFKFSLEDAINTINPTTGETYLVPYEYKPYFVGLTDEELEMYETKTEKIAKYYYKSIDDEEREKWFTLLCIHRQDIIKNANNKYNAFRGILEEIGENKIEYCLVYCSSNQMKTVQDILNEANIIQHKFTENEGKSPSNVFNGLSEREFLLKKFEKGIYQTLVSIKCLDVGVDVPPAKNAIILTSSGNSLEWVQRRGRVLRRFPGKEKAIIYDIIIVPSLYGVVEHNLLNLERRIFYKELIRYKEFSGIAINNLECLNKIYEIEKKLYL